MFYPALDVDSPDGDLILAIADDYSPTAVEESGSHVTIYFQDPTVRDRARDAIVRAYPGAVVSAREVDDEDWARRSQESLGAVTVGRIIVTPPGLPVAAALPALSIVIQPSTGFGTGHHATTRLCLAALQAVDLEELSVLDVGTGSGVLAIAARRLGAREAVGIDIDPDAIRAANENLELNTDADCVRFEVADMKTAPLGPADVVIANLTGAQLARSAALLRSSLRPGGVLIVSGLMTSERTEVLSAFRAFEEVSGSSEDEWACLTLRSPSGY